jgi:predicted dehydrogenase
MAEKTNPIRLLLIGGGGRCRTWARSALAAHPDYKVVGLVEPDAGNRNETREAYSIPEEICFKESVAALKSVECDAVLVATPMGIHAENCWQSLDFGRHVLCEKPFVTDFKEGLELAKAFEQKGLVLAVSQPQRASSGGTTLKRIVQEKTIGDIGYGHWYTYRNRLLVQEYQKSESWPQINAIAVHHVDLLRFIFDCEIRYLSVKGVTTPWSPYKYPAITDAWFVFENDVYVSYFHSFLSKAALGLMSQSYEGGVFEGDRGSVFFKGAVKNSEFVIAVEGKEKRMEERGDNGLSPERVYLDNFRDAVRKGSPPLCSARSNLWTIGTLKAMQFSAENQGREVEVVPFITSMGLER